MTLVNLEPDSWSGSSIADPLQQRLILWTTTEKYMVTSDQTELELILAE